MGTAISLTDGLTDCHLRGHGVTGASHLLCQRAQAEAEQLAQLAHVGQAAGTHAGVRVTCATQEGADQRVAVVWCQLA